MDNDSKIVELPTGLADRVHRFAEVLDISVDEIVREAIEHHVDVLAMAVRQSIGTAYRVGRKEDADRFSKLLRQLESPKQAR